MIKTAAPSLWRRAAPLSHPLLLLLLSLFLFPPSQLLTHTEMRSGPLFPQLADRQHQLFGPIVQPRFAYLSQPDSEKIVCVRARIESATLTWISSQQTSGFYFKGRTLAVKNFSPRYKISNTAEQTLGLRRRSLAAFAPPQISSSSSALGKTVRSQDVKLANWDFYGAG